MRIGLLVYIARGCGEEGIDERGGERLYFGRNQIKSRSLPGCPALGGILSGVMQRGEVLPKFRFDSGLSWMSLSYLRSLV